MRIARIIAPLLLLASAVACSSNQVEERNAGAVEVQNCGRTLRFDTPPKRIVSGWTTSTELLVELGAAENIVGQYNTASGTPTPKYSDALKKIPVLGTNAPTRESLLAARPDLIWADGDYLFNGQQLPTIDDLNAQGIQVLILSGFCTDDATKAKVRDVDTDLTALGTILGKQQRADKIKADIENRLSEVSTRIKDKEPVPVAMISTFNGTVYTYDGVYTDIAQLAGATNIYAGTLPSGKYFAELSVEDITKKNPGTLVYLLSGTETEQAARAFLADTLPTVSAVINKRIFFLPQTNSTNLAGIDGVTMLSSALHP